MKLNAKTIPDFLKKPDAHASGALIYGPDEGLVRERVESVLTALLGANSDPLQWMELPEEGLKADPARLSDELAAFSLLGGKRVIIARGEAEWFGKLVAQALEGPCAHYLVVQSGELTPRSSLRQLFEASAKLAALPCYADEAGDIERLLKGAMAEAGVRIEPQAVHYLVSQLGNDRQVTRSEIAKLTLYAGSGGSLSLADAEALVGYNKDVDLDAIALAVADGDLPKVDALINEAWREGAQAVAVLRTLQRHFHRLYQANAQMQAGKTPDAAVASLKPAVFFRQVPAVTRQVRLWTLPEIARALAAVAEGEAACKGGAAPILLCSRTLFSIASRARALSKVAA